MVGRGRWFVWMMWMVAGWLAAPHPARADGASIEVLMRVKPPDRLDAKTKDDAPQIEATVIGAPNLPADKFTLREEGAKQPIELRAATKREYNQGSEKLAVAIVMNGWEIWIGNDKLLPEEDPSRYPGVLEALEQALDKVDFKSAGPPGSLGTVITYADKAVIRIPMGPLDKITGQQLGTQKDYFGTKGVELVKGVDLALAELHKVQAARKVLIVVCDGMDTNMEAAKGQMQQLKAQAKVDQIQTFAILYKAASSGDGNVISTMIPSTSAVNSADNIATSIASILARMADRQYLTFPGFDAKLGIGLTWDGKPHNLILKVDKDDTDPVQLSMVPLWRVDKPGLPWLVIGLVLGAVAVLVIIGAALRRTTPAPLPLPVAEPLPVTAPKVPSPTIQITSNGGGDEFPIVGWLVPLNGMQAFQTLPLRSGGAGTKIGSESPADIVVQDQFISTHHCMVQASPLGFTLFDGGSTNGCYVNDHKVAVKQELFDNDTITLGRTRFRFKSIN